MEYYSQDKVCLTEMECGESGHEDSKLIAICIEQTCNAECKFLCLECIFEIHNQHKVIKLKALEDKINEKLLTTNFRQRNIQFISKLKQTEEKINFEIETIRTNILEIINNKANIFLSEINDRIFNSYKEANCNFDLDIFKSREIKDLSRSEYISFVNYLNYNFIQTDKQDKEKKRDLIEELEKIDNNINQYMVELNKQICDILNTKLSFNAQLFLPNSLRFEWSERIYSTYSFYYTLSDNNMSAIKTSNTGTITILRSKDKAKPGTNYYIEYHIDSKKGGDFEVGIGTDHVGTACWIRTPGAYGINNIGFYENGKIARKDIKLEDGDVIGFSIYLKESSPKKGICYKNRKAVHEFVIDIDEIYWIAAIRTIGNSVSVKEYKLINS